MPNFTFECKKCKKTFDYLVFDKSDVVKCPACSSTDLTKLITGCNVGGIAKHTPMGSVGSHSGGCACCPHKK